MSRFAIVFTLLLVLSIMQVAAQDPDRSKTVKAKTYREIPHTTIREKWLRPHRYFAHRITRERPIKFDTAYIGSNYKRLVVTLPLSTRFLQFNLVDPKSGNKLVFAPNLTYNLGLSISSRWASFIVNSGVKLYSGNQGVKGRTEQRDYQLNLYGRRITTDMFVQYYEGFYIRNSGSFDSYGGQQPYALREDVFALHMGVSSYYIVNNRKFSYGSSFAFTEQQKKSAGSLLIGIYYSYFNANGSPSLVSDSFRNDFDSLSFIQNAQIHDFGINLGYIYTLVIRKKFSVTGSVAQGAGGQHLFYSLENKSTYNKLKGGAGKLHLRLGLRYDNGRTFAGVMGIYDNVLFSGQSTSSLSYSFGKCLVYAGYRFSVLKAERRILRRLSLIDY